MFVVVCSLVENQYYPRTLFAEISSLCKTSNFAKSITQKNINNPLISNPLATFNQAVLNKVYWKGSQWNGKQTDISSILGLASM